MTIKLIYISGMHSAFVVLKMKKKSLMTFDVPTIIIKTLVIEQLQETHLNLRASIKTH